VVAPSDDEGRPGWTPDRPSVVLVPFG
jgi:hypothetical protein